MSRETGVRMPTVKRLPNTFNDQFTEAIDIISETMPNTPGRNYVLDGVGRIYWRKSERGITLLKYYDANSPFDKTITFEDESSHWIQELYELIVTAYRAPRMYTVYNSCPRN